MIAHTNAILDAHLAISTQEIPKSFREGLRYTSAPTEDKSRERRSEEKQMSPAKSDVSDENVDNTDKTLSVNDFQVSIFFGAIFNKFSLK